MRTFAIIFNLFALPFILLAEQKPVQLESDPSLYYYPPSQPQVSKTQQDEGDIAQNRSNLYEYNLYDRQQNRIDQQQRQQQQYYYQQSGNDNNGDQTQMRRNRRTTPQYQYFNPRDE